MYYETSFPVRYYETDQMGIVHHSNYIRYFECARNAMIREGGYPIEACEADGVVVPIVSVTCKFKHSARMGDTVRCTASISKLPLAKLYISQAVYNQDGILCAEGEVVLGFLDKATGRPVPCPEKLMEMIRSHIDEK